MDNDSRTSKRRILSEMKFVQDSCNFIVDKFEYQQIEDWTEEVQIFASNMAKYSSFIVGENYKAIANTRQDAIDALTKDIRRNVASLIKPHSYKVWLPEAKRYLVGYDFDEETDAEFQSMNEAAFLVSVKNYTEQFTTALLPVPKIEVHAFNSNGVKLKAIKWLTI